MENNTLPDFDTLKDLVEDSPEEVERILRANIEQIVENAPASQVRRLKGLQFQMDVQRQLAKNPIDSCLRLSRMMHESFLELNDKLNRAAQQRH